VETNLNPLLCETVQKLDTHGDYYCESTERCQIKIAFFFRCSTLRVPRNTLSGSTITLKTLCIVRTPLEEWSAGRRDLHLTTCKLSQATDIHATGGIRTRNTSKKVTVEPRLRSRDHQDRLKIVLWLSSMAWKQKQRITLNEMNYLFQCYAKYKPLSEVYLKHQIYFRQWAMYNVTHTMQKPSKEWRFHIINILCRLYPITITMKWLKKIASVYLFLKRSNANSVTNPNRNTYIHTHIHTYIHTLHYIPVHTNVHQFPTHIHRWKHVRTTVEFKFPQHCALTDDTDCMSCILRYFASHV